MTYRIKPFSCSKIVCTVLVEKTYEKLIIECESIETIQKTMESFLSDLEDLVELPFPDIKNEAGWVWRLSRSDQREFSSEPVTFNLIGKGFTVACRRILTVQRKGLSSEIKFLNHARAVTVFSIEQREINKYFDQQVQCVTPTGGYRLAALRCHQDVAKDALRALGALVEVHGDSWVDTDKTAHCT